MLLIILIVIFSLLILQNCWYRSTNLIENLNNKEDEEKYKPYTSLEKDPQNGPLFLALKNAANIQALHKEFDNVNNLKEKIQNNSEKIDANTKSLVTVKKSLVNITKKMTDASAQLYTNKHTK